MWNYANISRENFQQISKNEKGGLLIRYYNTMVSRFNSKFVFF